MRRIARMILLLGVITATGCSLTGSGVKVNLDVPFIPQVAPNHCGVTCLAMTLEYFRIAYEYQDLAREVYIPALSGSTPELIADTAELYGLKADIRSLPVTDIASTLARHRIPILFLPPASGEHIGHYILVHGTTSSPTTFRTHDGIARNRRRKLVLDVYPAIVLEMTRQSLTGHAL